MNPFLPLGQLLVYAVMAVSLVAAVCVVTLRNIFHAALALMAVLVGVAGIYVALHAEFLAVVQILLYVGGVLTLMVFAIMMTEKLGEASVPQQNALMLPAVLASVTVFLVLFKLLVRPTWLLRPQTLGARVSVADLGRAFLDAYLFPFEVISVILIVVLIGALIVAKRDKEGA